MKRVNNLYNFICDIDVISNIYNNVIKKNTRNKRKIQYFEDNYSTNIKRIKDILITRKYYPSKYNIFLIKDPKYRIIMSQSIEDKIINHLVSKYFLSDVFDKTFVNENCATRKNKGTHYALKLFKKYLNNYKNKYNNFYILKIDISKYFYNIDHNIVKTILKHKIKDKDVLDILNIIIDSTDELYVNKEIKRLKNKEIKYINNLNINIKDKIKRINEINNIPYYKKEKGFPIGNMSSQIIATLYLNHIDHYIKYDLKCDFVRYMDDIIIIHNNKNYLRECIKLIEKQLIFFNLEINHKSKIYSSNEGIEFLGFRFYIKNNIVMKLTNKCKKRFIYKMSKYNYYYYNGLISYNDYRSVRDSYIGHLSYGNCYNLLKKISE